MDPRVSSRILLAAGFLLLPTATAAQFLGAWVPPAGRLTAQIYAAYSDTDAWFCGPNLGHCTKGERGNLSDTIQSENARTGSVGLQVEFAPLAGISVGAALPFHSLRYRKDFGGGQVLPLETDGLGDLRLAVRGGTGWGPWAVAGGYAVEFPTGEFAISSAVAPVGSGTRNHDLFVEVGRSLWPAPFYAEAGALHRWREAHVSEDGVVTDWGDEWHGKLKVGWNAGRRWTVQGQVLGYRSGERTTNIPGEPRDQYRSRLTVSPSLLYRFSRGWVLGWVGVPLSGRNAPASPGFGLAVAGAFEARGKD